MSEKEQLEQRERLERALRLSFKKMIEYKKKMGLSIIIGDGKGNPIEISAEEAEKIAFGE